MLEDEYEHEARELEKERVVEHVADPDPFTEARWDELVALCADVHAIWRASTTEIHDRKQLLRLLVRAVIVETAEPERLKLRVEWTDGLAPAAVEILRPPYFRRVISTLHQAGRSIDEIVAHLAELGPRTLKGNPWSKETVRSVIALQSRRSR
jgi:hypothetical protein